MNLEVLESYARIMDALVDGNQPDKDCITGFLDFNDEILNDLRKIEKDDLCSSLIELWDESVYKTSFNLSDSFSEKHFKFRVKVNLSSMKIHSSYFICDKWDTLLNYSDYLLHPVKAVYFTDNKRLEKSGCGGIKFDNYERISKVCKLIKEVADAKNGDDYIVLCGQPLYVQFVVKEESLSEDIDLGVLEELLIRDLHQEAKKSLVRETLYNFLSDKNPQLRFGYLITHFNAFSAQLLTSYEQYVRNYSFDKVRKEHQEKYSEFIARINKVFDDVATKTFAIPAGVWFAASQIEASSPGNFQFMKNIVYVLMVVFLTAVVVVNLFGQFSTLSAIKDEYMPLFERLRNEPTIDSEEINQSVRNMDSRRSCVWWKLAGTIAFSIVMVVITITIAGYSILQTS